MTIFYNATHTFMRIGGPLLRNQHEPPRGGAGWISTAKLPADYLANFSEVARPQLGDNAFAPAGPRRPRHGAAARARLSAPPSAPPRGERRLGDSLLTARLTKLPSYGARMMLAFPGI